MFVHTDLGFPRVFRDFPDGDHAPIVAPFCQRLSRVLFFPTTLEVVLVRLSPLDGRAECRGSDCCACCHYPVVVWRGDQMPPDVAAGHRAVYELEAAAEPWLDYLVEHESTPAGVRQALEEFLKWCNTPTPSTTVPCS